MVRSKTYQAPFRVPVIWITASFRVRGWVGNKKQGGKDRAEYGTGLLKRLSADLRIRHGKGFSRSNLMCMR